MLIKAAICNFENNGGGNRSLWQEMHKKLASLGLHLLLRQEMWDAQDNGGELADAAEAVLGMAGLIGKKSCTAIYHDPAIFTPAGEWTDTGPMWVLPPTVQRLRLSGTAPDAPPLIVGSYHLNYASSSNRLSEAEWLTTWNDQWTKIGGRRVKLPALLGGDNNSYPVPGAPGDPVLPLLEEIADKPHRVHRSYIGPDGSRRMDDRPDERLHAAGLHDVARHLATTKGDTAAVSPTVDTSPTHGPQSRIDRLYGSEEILRAVHGIKVYDMSGKSDHHTVVVSLCRDALTEILNRPITRKA
ncbi:hypothetical protein ACVWZD_000453 [Streptomyces sp. TE3672]